MISQRWLWKHSVLKHGSHRPPPQFSITNMQVNFTNFVRHNCVRINISLPTFRHKGVFLFPCWGGGEWMITPLKSGGEEERINLSEPRLYLFNTLMGFLMRGGCTGRLHNGLIQQGPSVHIYMSSSLGDRANCFSSLLLLLISNFYWHASISQVPSVPAPCCHNSPHHSFPFDFFFLSTGQWEEGKKKFHQAASGC